MSVYYLQKYGVRVTHIPTGITILVDAYRSQHQNKRMAIKFIQAKLRAMDNQQPQTKFLYDIPPEGRQYPDELGEFRTQDN